MNQIRMGVIGAGGIGVGSHMAGINRSPDLLLTAICDIVPEKMIAPAKKYDIDKDHLFTDYRDLIACGDVDAVCVCTPNDCHFKITREAIKAGKPYVLEKPVTMTAREAEILAFETGSLKNMVCFSYRFVTAARYARHLVRSGALGKIYHVNMEYSQAWDSGSPLVWRFIKSIAGSGALGDLGSHAIDLVRFLTGKEYTRVAGDADTYVKERRLPEGGGTGFTDVDDYCNFLARMDGGISASFHITRCAFGRANYQRMVVYGDQGALVYKLNESPGRDELELCIGQPMGRLHTFTAVPVPNEYAADQLQSFADIMNGRADGLSADISDGFANQKMLGAVIESFESGRWINLT